jgi:AAA15 family ATPase/GTPase
LSDFDIPIADIEVTREPVDIEKFAKFLSKEAIDSLFAGKAFDDRREPVFFHKAESGDLVKFTAADESSGTMSLFGFASRWIEAIENDWILVVDELDSSLHPLVVWELIRKLSESKSKAQLIFTTHDATVMQSKLLRRDQVYFVSADKSRSTRLYSLFDFKGREDDPFEDRYLQGRYGATPILTR